MLKNGTINGRIIQKHDTEDSWKLAKYFMPKKGEIIIYDMYDKNGNKVASRVRHKIGDGIHYVNDLPFIDTTYISIVDNQDGTGTVLDDTDISTESMDELLESGLVFIKLYPDISYYPDETHELLSLEYCDWDNTQYYFTNRTTSLCIDYQHAQGEGQNPIRISAIPQFKVDTKLTRSGYAADAKAVGDALKGYVKKGESDNETATVIGTGTATGDGATVIGSGTAEGTGSTVIGSGTATGDYSVAEGANTLAGCKGYYIRAIDPTNRHIYLYTGEVTESTRIIPTWNNPSSYYDSTFKSYYVLYGTDDLIETPHGNEFSVGSDSYYHWPFAGQIIEINGNRITYSENNSLDETAKWINKNGAYNNQLDPMTFFIPEQPDCGTVNVGLGSHAEGWNTKAAAQHSHTEGESSIAAGRYGHAEGRQTRAGFAAHAEGQNTLAKGLYSHSEGANTKALQSGAHAEGTNTTADETNAHAEGSNTTALGQSSHIEGRSSNEALEIVSDLSESSSYDYIKPLWDSEGFSAVLGDAAHAEGLNTIAKKQGHAEGYRTISWGDASHSEGYKTSAIGKYSHVEGTENIANSLASHAEGLGTIANGKAQHVEGRYNTKDTTLDKDGYGQYAHVVGNGSGPSDAERSNAYTLDWNGNAWFAGGIKANKGFNVITSETAVGQKTVNNGEIFNNYDSNQAEGKYTHAEGSGTTAVGESSHAEGLRTTALGIYSHAEGRATNKATSIITDFTSAKKYSDYTINGQDTLKQAWDKNKFSLAIGECAHSEGVNTIAGSYAHAEGEQTIASGNKSHAEGTKTQANGLSSHAEGEGTIVNKRCQHVQGKYNIEDTSTKTYGKYAHIVGNGDSTTPSNAHALDWDGNAYFAGNVYVGSGLADENAIRLPRFYSGTSVPDDSIGQDGDIYIVYEE